MVEVPERILHETGLSIEFVLKEIKLNEFLAEWVLACSEKKIDYSLFGGTALNKIYLRQPRFSEDVDVLVYGSSIKKIFSLLKEFKGFKPKAPERIFREAYRITLEYDFPENKVRDKINLDANLNVSERRTPAVREQPESFLSQYGFNVFLPKASTFEPTTFAAMKLLAIFFREEGKDFFDLHQLLQKYSFKKSSLLNEAHKYKNCFFDFAQLEENFLEQAVRAIEGADEKNLGACNDYVFRKHRRDWTLVKKDLIRLIETKII